MSQATKDTAWKISADLGKITTSNVSKTLTIDTNGKYVDRNIEVTVSATKPDAAVLATTATSGVTYSESPTDAQLIIPSQGALYINAGYIGNTKITLDEMLEGRADTAGIASTDIRQGKIAYDVDGKKLTGNMPNATVVGGTISHTLGDPTYNSTSGVFDMSCDITTGAPTVSQAGYISSSVGTKTASTKVSENHTLNKIAGTVSVSGTKTVTPQISKQSTPTGVTNAASGDATTTAPSSGVYVAVKSAAKTTNVTASASITTAGYGDATNHGITNSGNVAVGAGDSATTYVPIKTTSIVHTDASGSGGSVSATKTSKLQTTTTANDFGFTFSTTNGSISCSADVPGSGWVTKGEVTATITTTPSKPNNVYIVPKAVSGTGATATAAATATESVDKNSVTGYNAPVTVAVSTTVPQLVMTATGGATATASASHNVTTNDIGKVISSVSAITATDTKTDSKTDTKYINYYTGTYTLV